MPYTIDDNVPYSYGGLLRGLRHMLRLRFAWWCHGRRSMGPVWSSSKGYDEVCHIEGPVPGTLDLWRVEGDRVVLGSAIDYMRDATDMTGHKHNALNF